MTFNDCRPNGERDGAPIPQVEGIREVVPAMFPYPIVAQTTGFATDSGYSALLGFEGSLRRFSSAGELGDHARGFQPGFTEARLAQAVGDSFAPAFVSCELHHRAFGGVGK